MLSNKHHSSGGTKRRIRNCLWGAVFVAATTVFLVNCGGGSDSGDSSAKSAAGETLNPGLSGLFWTVDIEIGSRSFFIDAKTGNTARADFPTNVSVWRHSLVSVARDGRLFVSQNVREQQDTAILTIHPVPKTQIKGDVANLYTLPLKTDVALVVLSPDSHYMAVIYTDGNSVTADKNGLAIYDLQNQANVNSVNPKRIHDTGFTTNTKIMSFDWLPNGEYRYIFRDDRMMAGSVANASLPDKPAGKIVAPAGHATTTDFAISPDGKQIATTFVGRKELDGSLVSTRDVWVTDITGGNAQRVTNDEATTRPLWSPDGKFFALSTTYIGASIGGIEDNPCDHWYAPSTARNVGYQSGGRPIKHTAFGDYVVSTMICPPMDFYWTE
jgi:hypothetical protein